MESASSRREEPTRKSKGKHGRYLGSFPSPLRRLLPIHALTKKNGRIRGGGGGGKRAYQAASNNSRLYFDRLLFREVSRFEDTLLLLALENFISAYLGLETLWCLIADISFGNEEELKLGKKKRKGRKREFLIRRSLN